MKVSITGGAGISTNIVNSLIDECFAVIIVDDLSSCYENNINQKAKFIKLDI